MIPINQRIRQAGVVWHACDGCGRDWPFPMGIPPSVNPKMHEDRDWRCHACVQAALARVRRVTELMQLPKEQMSKIFTDA